MSNNDDRIRLKEYGAYGLGSAGIILLAGSTGTYILFYLTNVVLLDVAVISAIIAVSKLLDGISDLIIGSIVDRTVSKMGKARIWMLRMCIPYAVSMLLIFMVPANIPQLAKYIYIFLIYNLAHTVCYTFMNVPLYSMVSLMSADRREHSIAGNIAAVSGNAGAFIGSSLFVRLLMLFTDEPGNQNTQRAYTCTLAVYALIMVVFVLVMVFSTRERVCFSDTEDGKNRDPRELFRTFGIMIKDKNWLVLFISGLGESIALAMYITGATYFAMYILKDIGAMSWLIPAFSIPSVVIMMITPFFVGRVNKKKMKVGGLLICSMASAALGIFAHSGSEIAVLLLVCSIGGGIHNSVFYGMVADAVSYTSRKTGKIIAGTGNAVISAVKKLGSGLATIFIGFGLSIAGFNASLDAQGIAQPDSVLNMIRTLYLWVPCAIFVITMIVFILFYDLEDKMSSSAE